MDYILSKVKHLLKVNLGAGSILVRAKGIEPSPKAWEAFVLPLYYARNVWRNIILFYRQCPEFISGVVLVCRPAVLQRMNFAVCPPLPI